MDAILDGQRDANELAKLRDCQIRADEEAIRKSLVGTWKPEHLFTLKQSREFYRMYQEQVVECDHEIERLLHGIEPWTDPSLKPLPPERKRNRSDKKRRKRNGDVGTPFDLRTEAYKLFGVDVTQIPGVENIALPLFNEVGRDLSKWPTSTHFASWLGEGSARIMTSAGAESFGGERAKLRTEPPNCSGWPPILYIGALPLWAPIFGG